MSDKELLDVYSSSVDSAFRSAIHVQTPIPKTISANGKPDATAAACNDRTVASIPIRCLCLICVIPR